MIPSWNRRTWVHGDLADINPFGHRMPGPAKVIVADGAVIDPERFAEIVGQYDTQELTPESRLDAIHTVAYARPVKPKRAFETEDAPVEHYTRIEDLVKRENRISEDDEFELAQRSVERRKAA